MVKEGFSGAATPVYDGIDVIGKWKSCVDSGDSSSCFLMGSATDRAYFGVEVIAGLMEEYSMGLPPRVEVDHMTGPVKATVADFESPGTTVDVVGDAQANAVGWFLVIVDCRTASDSTARVMVTLEVKELANITFAWLKLCGSGPHPAVEMGIFVDGDHDGIPLTGSRYEGSVPVEEEDFGGSPVYLMLQYPSLYLEFLRPVILVNDPRILTAALRGFVDGGVISYRQGVTVFVSYTCNANGTTNLSITVPIPPFEPLHGTWQKKCTKTPWKGLPQALQIELVNPLRTVVYQSRSVSEEFQASSSVRSGLWRVAPAEKTTTFRVTNVGSDVYLIRPPMAHAVNPRMVHTTVYNEGIMASATSSNILATASTLNVTTAEALASRASLDITVRTICLKAGTTSILLSILADGHNPIEVQFEKECLNPRIRRHRAFLTAGRILWLVYLGALILLGIAVARAARQRGPVSFTSKQSTHNPPMSRLVTPVIDRV
uniref:Uncharacterized protein n=1 Tax=Compsopogon caeruleus TaxID=31354 RepID=A0A6T6AEN3_9RHOD